MPSVALGKQAVPCHVRGEIRPPQASDWQRAAKSLLLAFLCFVLAAFVRPPVAFVKGVSLSDGNIAWRHDWVTDLQELWYCHILELAAVFLFLRAVYFTVRAVRAVWGS